MTPSLRLNWAQAAAGSLRRWPRTTVRMCQDEVGAVMATVGVEVALRAAELDQPRVDPANPPWRVDPDLAALSTVRLPT